MLKRAKAYSLKDEEIRRAYNAGAQDVLESLLDQLCYRWRVGDSVIDLEFLRIWVTEVRTREANKVMLGQAPLDDHGNPQ